MPPNQIVAILEKTTDQPLSLIIGSTVIFDIEPLPEAINIVNNLTDAELKQTEMIILEDLGKFNLKLKKNYIFHNFAFKMHRQDN
jgi:hypothetical protein